MSVAMIDPPLPPRRGDSLTHAQRHAAKILDIQPSRAVSVFHELVAANPTLAPRFDVDPGLAAALASSYRPPSDLVTPTDTAGATGIDGLMSVIRTWKLNDGERAATSAMMRGLDTLGYLTRDITEIAHTAGIRPQHAEQLRRRLLSTAPFGCGARDRQEFLTLEVARLWPDDAPLHTLVRHHLASLDRRRYDELATSLDIDVEDIREYHRMLTEQVRSSPLGGRTHLSNGMTLRVAWCARTTMWRVSAPQRARSTPRSAEWDEHLRLLKQIADLAVTRQRLFLEGGEDRLGPLTMVDLGEVLGKNVSTISRAIGACRIVTHRGEFPLRKLFSARAAGGDASVHQLQAAIRLILSREPPPRPLSDEEIARLLIRRGMTASRRTVQKHRERMGVPSSRTRHKSSG